MVYDTDFRENPTAAVDTAYPLTAQGSNTPGAFVVPTNVSRITSIKIFVSGILTDVVQGTTCEVHLYGGGIKLPNGWFAGPVVSVSGAAATSGGWAYGKAQEYKTNITVNPGGRFSADAFIHGAGTTRHVLLLVEYDGIAGKVVDADCRYGAIGASANTLVALANRGAAVAEGDFTPTGQICEVNFAAALTPTGDAENGLVFAPALQLTGPGLVSAGNYQFLGPSGPTQPDTDVAGNQSIVQQLERYLCSIATKTGSSIRPSAQNIESINPSNAIVCLCYS